MAQDKLKNLDYLKTIVTKLPKTPGCYLFYSISGEVLYVGKAKNLRSRVASYFSSDHKGSPKTRYLVDKIRDLSFELTESDAEAFVLENILIKKHRPKYNIRLKDDKSYPYVIIDKTKKFPSIEFRRRVKKDKSSLCFGPFVQGSNISKTLKEVLKAFSLRDCSDYEFSSRSEPCLLFQMHQCSAPCVDLISIEDYKKRLELAASIFKGKPKSALLYLKKQMSLFSENEEFEKALLLRDSVKVIEDFSESFKEIASAEGGRSEDLDLVNFHLSDHEIDLSIAIIRGGVHFGHKAFYYFRSDFEEDGVPFIRLVCQFYIQYLINSSDTLPKKVFIQGVDKEDGILKKQIEFSLEQLIRKKIKVFGSAKRNKNLIDLNNRQSEENYKLRSYEKSSVLLALKKLQTILSLREVPRTLECYDVAIFQGKSPTASQVNFFDGAPDKKNYRHYHLKELEEGNNDFAMMNEVAKRRVKKGNLPDVFIVDGGKGQVTSFVKGLGGAQISVIGIAKSKTKSNFKNSTIQSTEERLIIPGRKDSYTLTRGSALFRVITQMRDEAHRFSRRLHHQKENKKVNLSWLDSVEGIGEKTKVKILNNLKMTKQELSKLTSEEIKHELGVSVNIAQNIYDFLSN
jgi:excinuclease ABC subunit C